MDKIQQKYEFECEKMHTLEMTTREFPNDRFIEEMKQVLNETRIRVKVLEELLE